MCLFIVCGSVDTNHYVSDLGSLYALYQWLPGLGGTFPLPIVLDFPVRIKQDIAVIILILMVILKFPFIFNNAKWVDARSETALMDYLFFYLPKCSL